MTLRPPFGHLEVISFLLMALVLSTTGLARSQYVFLDSDGDGTNSTADKVSIWGPTVVDIWIDTSKNRDGTAAACPSYDSGMITMQAYTLVLHAEGGAVAWGGFVNHLDPWTVRASRSLAGIEFYAEAYGPVPLEPGRYRLATVTATIISGRPSLTLVPSSTVAGEDEVTAIATGSWGCSGTDYDNLLKLGRDWYDSDGISAPADVPQVLAPDHMTGDQGISFPVRLFDPEHVAGSLAPPTLSPVPNGAQPTLTISADGASGTFDWDVSDEPPGTYDIQFPAQSPGVVPARTRVEVRPDHPPMLGSLTQAVFYSGVLSSVDIPVEDPDGDSIDSAFVDTSQFPSDNPPILRYSRFPVVLSLTWMPRSSDVGAREVAVTIRNALTTSDIVRVNATARPTARLTQITHGSSAPCSVTLDGATSTDPDGMIIAYEIDSGDGVTSSPGAVSGLTHSYEAGSYTATLTVWDDAGGTNSTSTAIVVPRPGPLMSLDTNGDSVTTSDDRLSRWGSTAVNVWLDTTHNWAGRPAECSSQDGALTVNSYEVILHATGGSVAWGTVTNRMPTMVIELPQVKAANDWYFAFAGTDLLPPGKYLLATATITTRSGSPGIEIASTLPTAGIQETSFGSQCAGRDFDNTLKLGSDWFDVEGLCAPADTVGASIFPAHAADTRGPASDGDPGYCIQLEAAGSTWDPIQVRLETVRLRVQGSPIETWLRPWGKPLVSGGDENANGRPELTLCFPRDQVLSALSAQSGNSSSLELIGRLSEGAEFLGVLPVDVPGGTNGLSTRVFPNPAPHAASLHLRHVAPGAVNVMIFDIHGRLLAKKSVTRDEAAEDLDVDLGGLLRATAAPRSGLYFYRVEIGKESRSGKFIILR